MNAVSKRPPVFLKPDVITISPAPSGTKKLRVAGYCRVSTDFAAQDSSIELQKNHYRNYILSNPDWELAEKGEVQEENGVRFSFDIYKKK